MLEKYESFFYQKKRKNLEIYVNELFDKTFLNEEVISNDGGFVINEKLTLSEKF